MTLARHMTRRGTLGLAISLAGLPAGHWLIRPTVAATSPIVRVWKDPGCACCNGWIAHMRQSGFSVTVHDTHDLDAVKQTRGVPEALQSCHTAVVGDYVIEGHVPASDIERLLVERPPAKGLAVPGMPQSAPGMDQPGVPYTVVLFGAADGDRPYAQH